MAPAIDSVYTRIGLGPYHFFSLFFVGCYYVTESMLNIYSSVIAKAAQKEWDLSEAQFYAILVARDCGIILTGVGLPWLGDKYGRLPVMRWGLLGRFAGIIMCATALSYPWMLTGLFLMGLFLGFNRPAVSCFSIEILPIKLRAAILIGLFVFIITGAIGSAAIAFYILPVTAPEHWRTLVLITSAPTLAGLVAATVLFMEPPRYSAMVGNYRKSIRGFNKIAKWCLKVPLTDEEIEVVRNQPLRKEYSLKRSTFQLLSPQYRGRLAYILWIWFLTGYQYTACMASFPDNLSPYTSNPLMPIEIATLANAFFVPMPTVEMPRFGRRWTLMSFIVLQALFCMAAILISDPFAFALAVIPYVIALTLSLRVIYPFTLELFETSLRCYVFGLCYAAARVGALLARLQPVRPQDGSISVMLVFNIVGILAVLKAPYETVGQPLEDYTLKDAN